MGRKGSDNASFIIRFQAVEAAAPPAAEITQHCKSPIHALNRSDPYLTSEIDTRLGVFLKNK